MARLPLTKRMLEHKLHNIRGFYMVGFAGFVLLNHKDSPKVLRNVDITLGGVKIDFKRIAEMLENEDDKKWILKQYHGIFIRFVSRESFEMIKDYCKRTNQMKKLNSQKWYHFARLIRNSMAHNFKWTFSQSDKSILPLKWRSRTISRNLEGHELTQKYFSLAHAWNLNNDMQIFVKKELK